MPRLWDNKAEAFVEVGHDEVNQRLATGQYGLHSDEVDNEGRVRVTAPDGAGGSIPAADLSEAIRRGYRLETPEAAARADTQQWAARRGANPVEAALTGFGDIATLGVLPQAMQKLGEAMDVPDAYRAYREQLEKQNPLATAGGKIAGALVPGAAMGGVLRGTQAALAARGAGQLAQTVGGLAVAGAAEGAVTGAAELVAEDALGRADMLSEDILSYVGGGALFGAGIGGALGLGGAALRGVARGLKPTAAAKAAAQAQKADALAAVADDTEGVVKSLYDERGGQSVARFAAQMAGKDGDMVARYLDPGKAGKALREKAHWGAQKSNRDAAAIELKKLLDKNADLFARVSDEARGAKKTANIAKLVEPQAAAAGVDDALGAVRQIQDEVGTIIKDAPAFYGTLSLRYANQAQRYLKSIIPKLDELGRKVRGGSKNDAAEFFSTMDGVKRRLSEWAKPAGFVKGSDIDGINIFRNNYERLRQHLERVDIYGNAAKAQASNNAAFTEWLSTEKIFRKKFMEFTGEQDWQKVFRAQSGKLSQFLDNLGAPGQELGREVLENHVRGMAKLADSIGEKFVLDADGMADQLAMRESSAQLRKFLDQTFDSIEAANDLAELSKAGDSFRKFSIGTFAKGLQAAEIGYDRFRQVFGLEALGKRIKNVDGRINKSIDKIARWDLGRGLRGVPAVTRTAFFQTPLGPAKRAFTRAPTAEDDRRKAFAERAKEINDLMANPDAMADRLAANLSDLEMVAPKTAAATGALSAKVVQYLYDKMPKKPSQGNTLTPLADDWYPSSAEIARFARYYNAAMEPLSVLEDLESGALTREAVETVRTLYPSLHQRITKRIAERAATRTEPLPYKARTQLSILFGMPLDPTMRPERIAQLQQNLSSVPSPDKPAGQNPPPGRAGGGMRATGLAKVTLGESTKTRTQRIGEHL